MSKPSVEEFRKSHQHFDWPDYTVCVLMLSVCIAIGLFFGRRRGGKNTPKVLEYLVGGRNLQVFPVSMSLIASAVSGIAMLGISTEIYLYGMHYIFVTLAIVPFALVMQFFILPVLHELKCVSLYEYLERRFDKSLRLFGSILYLLGVFIRLPITMYIPVIVFNQVTGIEMYISTPVIAVVCLFYTCVGGFKGVVWTDVVQAFIMLGSMVLVATRATLYVGGVGVVLNRNINSTRIEIPVFNIDPTIRDTFWSCFIGGLFLQLAWLGLEQSMIQRYVSLPTLRQARQALWIFALGFFIISAFSIYNGFLLYSVYHECDPLRTGLVKRPDQLISLLVTDTLNGIPLILGVFIAGILSGSLSTISTALNSMSAVVYEDFIKLRCGNRLSENETMLMIRCLVVVIGVAMTALVFVVERLGTVIQLIITVKGVFNGPLIGIFIIGLTMPWIGSKPTLVAALIAVLLSGWSLFQTKADISTGILSYVKKPTSIDNCTYTFDAVFKAPPVESEKEFYQLSYMYYSFFGAVVTVLVANLLSLASLRQRRTDPKLLTPVVRKIYERRFLHNIPMQTMSSVYNFDSTYVPKSAPQVF